MQQHPAIGLAAGYPHAALGIEPVQHPLRRPQRAGQVQRVGGRAAATSDDMVPGATPAHKAGMAADHVVIAASQHGEAPAAAGPVLQGLDHRTLAQGPVMEVGITDENFLPAIPRRRRNGVAHQLLKRLAPAESPAGQVAQRLGRGGGCIGHHWLLVILHRPRHGPSPHRTTTKAAPARRRWPGPDPVPPVGAHRQGAASAWRHALPHGSFHR